MEHIKEIISEYDEITMKNNKYSVINLVGRFENNPFLSALDRKAAKLGIVSVHNESSDRFKTVVDIETADHDYKVNSENDIDNTSKYGLSAVAEGVYQIINKYGMVHGRHVLIIGRGHSVKGLSDKLVSEGATVTIAHSKSVDIDKLCDEVDVIVSSTNNIDFAKYADKLVINIADGTPRGLSGITTSILLKRAVVG